MTLDELEGKIKQLPGVQGISRAKNILGNTLIHVYCGGYWTIELVDKCIDLKWDFIESTNGKEVIDIDIVEEIYREVT
jgi:hypothetical protein